MQEQTPRLTARHQFSRLFLRVFGLTFLIPVLAVVYYVIRSNSSDKGVDLSAVLPLFITASISLLGLCLIYRILRGAMLLLENLDRFQPASQSSSMVGIDVSSRDLNDTLEKLNRTTSRFEEKAHDLDGLITRIQALTDANELASRVVEMKELLTLVLHKAMLATHAGKGTVMLKREQGGELEVIATEGWTPNLAGPINCADTLAGGVIESGRPLLAGDTGQAAPEPRLNNDQTYSSPSFIIMPIATRIEVIGALCLSEKENSAQFDAADQQFLAALFSQVGNVIGNARLIQESRETIRSLEDRVALQETRLHQARCMIQRADRLSVLGQLVAGVAHEINNPLTTVLGYSQLLLESVERNGNHARELRKIFDESSRAAGIVRNLLMFAHEQRPGRTAVNLNDLIRHVVSLREYDLRMRNIDISTDFDESIAPVLLDAGRIQQVLLNLINNSAEAATQAKECKIRIGTSHTEDRITVWISDTGKGIPQALQENVFEPFVSSHSNRGHTGLGLSLSREIIEDHGGTIQLVSVEGQGTRITIDLPLVQAPPEPAGSPEPPIEGPQRFENQFALSIDDEVDNAELVAVILERMGFHVEVMTESPAALRRLAQESFDLVVCNIRMPEIDGRQLYRDLKKVRPRSFPKMIFTTGDAVDPDARLFVENNKLCLISKPFMSENLIQTILEEFTVRT